MEPEDGARVSTAYLRFAEDEVRDKSPLYCELLRGAAADPAVIGFLLTLPREKRQPNLFLAAARHLFGTPAGWDQLRSRVLQDTDTLRAVMLARSTQTNEPGRCAALLPVLAGLPEPLALLEVGASAGLCLLPDFYAYDYGGALVAPEVQRLTSPVFTCAINAATPVPTRPPRVVWRAGLDLNPVDLADPAEVAWLEALVWPEQTDRLARLRAAIMIAAEQKPGQRRPTHRPRGARPRGAKGCYARHLPHGCIGLHLPSGGTGGVRTIGRLALRLLDRERSAAGVSGHRSPRQLGGTEGQLPPVRERCSNGLGRSAWRMARLGRGHLPCG